MMLKNVDHDPLTVKISLKSVSRFLRPYLTEQLTNTEAATAHTVKLVVSVTDGTEHGDARCLLK